MGTAPFTRLRSRRIISRAGWSKALIDFYAMHEGAGLESDPGQSVRLCKWVEVQSVRCGDIMILNDDIEGWEGFHGYRIGIGSFLDDLLLVQTSPCCPAGSILALGPDVAGPGGTGDQTLEPSLILASSLESWMKWLEENAWTEYGLAPGDIENLTPARQKVIRRHYLHLNPEITWASES